MLLFVKKIEYLKEREGGKEEEREERERDVFHLLDHFLSGCNGPGLGQVEGWRLKCHLCLPRERQGPKHMGHFWLLSQVN